MKRELTNEEKDIYKKSLERLKEEIADLDMLIRSQRIYVEEGLAYEFKTQKRKEEEELKDKLARFEEKRLAFEDCSNKLRDGYVESKEE